MWVGSAHDVINDAASRARFRLALEAADRAFAVDADDDDLSRMTMVWDLEGAEPVNEPQRRLKALFPNRSQLERHC